VPAGTVGNWVRGYEYPTRIGRRRAARLIEPPAGDGALSFANLVEANTLAAFRAAGVSMQKIRPAVTYLGRHLAVEHPLASRHFLTDGAEIFFRYIKAEGDNEIVTLLNLSQGGQVVFDEVVDRYLHRVDWAHDDYASRFWPAGRDEGIVIEPGLGFGDPVVANTGVRVATVVDRLLAGDKRAVVADDFGLTPDDLAAIERFARRLPAAA
jgi:uncharacterized protein (DUF433 family)